MSSLFVDKRTINVKVKLASAIGLNEAIVLQQIYYWTEKKLHFKDGHYWVFNSVKQWQENFPFWSESTIKRIIKNLEENNYIITGNYNEKRYDKTKWYRLNDEVLEKLERDLTPSVQNEPRQPLGQNDPTPSVQNEPMEESNMTQPIPKSSTKSNTKSTLINNTSFNNDEEFENKFESFWKLYPRKLEKKVAKTKFKIALKKHSFEEILIGTKRYNDYLVAMKTETQYIKHPKTFLSQEAYMDKHEIPVMKNYKQQPKTHTNEQYMYSNDMKDDGLPF